MLSHLKGYFTTGGPAVSHPEKWVSGVGAWLSILAIYGVSGLVLDDQSQLFIVASMGASAVLLFAVPHGALSQPWNLIGGHLISAVIGVSCGYLINDVILAAASAVGLAVFVMHYARCIHPPGGATALFAVIGGESVHALGYGYVVVPVLVNVLTMLLVAVAFNALFRWRRYPLALSARPAAVGSNAAISHEDFVYALSEIDSVIDVSEQDLLTIYDLATRHRERRQDGPLELKVGGFYSNGSFGDTWSVRQIIDWDDIRDSDEPGLMFKIITGPGRRQTHRSSVQQFQQWASHEVYLDEENWRKVEAGRDNP